MIPQNVGILMSDFFIILILFTHLTGEQEIAILPHEKWIRSSQY